MTISQQSLQAYRAELLRQEKSQMTVQIYTKNCREFLYFVQAGLKSLPFGKAIVHTWKTSLSTAGLSPATVNVKLAAVNGFLRFLGRPECCVRQVRRQRRVFRDKGRDLSHSEYLRLVQAAKRQGRERLCLVLQTICATGIRVSELRFVTVEAVRTGRATVTGKGKCREILLPGKLRARLKEYLKHSGRWPGQANVPVFLTAGGRPLDRSNLWREMRSLCAAAKVDPHKVFPHRGGRPVQQIGGQVAAVQKAQQPVGRGNMRVDGAVGVPVPMHFCDPCRQRARPDLAALPHKLPQPL